MSSNSRPSSSGSSSGSHTPHVHHDDAASHPSSEASSSSSSSSSSSTSRLPNPGALLPPLTGPSGPSSSGSGGKPGGPILANEILDPELHAHHAHHSTSARNPVPEKCLTFCSQSQDQQAICRMFCLRRRRPIVSQADQLARLRPASASVGSKKREEEEAGWGFGFGWNPFKALEKRAAPWSFIYVKGTPEGVVGRYMEELQQDDGNRDFGGISRGATDLQRRRGPGGMEYIDWEEHGSLLHLPFTSLLSPIISLPDNIARVFSPSLGLIQRYRASFSDGAQERNFDRLRTEVVNGGAFTFFGKLNAHYRKIVNERKAEILKQREEREKQRDKQLSEQKDKFVQEKMEKYEAARREQER